GGIETYSDVEPTFYNVNISTDDAGTEWQIFDNVTVENALTITTGNLVMRTPGTTLTLGTPTSSGTFTTSANGTLQTHDGPSTIQGVSSLYPAVCSGTDWDWSYSNPEDIHLANIDYQVDAVMDGSGTQIILDGDCSFRGVTVASGATLNASGQRVQFEGMYTNSGTLVASGAQIHFGTSGLPAGSNYADTVYLGNNDTQWWCRKSDTHRWPQNQNLGTIFLNQTGNIYSDRTVGSNTYNETNFLLGGTDSCQFTNQHDHHFKNFKLGISSKYIAADKTTSIHGNMTNGGGMHGVFTASFNGTDDYMKVENLNASYNGASTAVPTGYLDAWIRTTASDGTIIHQRTTADSATAFKMRVVG
ncbi:MAG: hypothetical protein QF535_09895, partial [Anaerolineales bacterium]|nr:hypothetical protein [Anaerolineales bacterium]